MIITKIFIGCTHVFCEERLYYVLYKNDGPALGWKFTKRFFLGQFGTGIEQQVGSRRRTRTSSHREPWVALSRHMLYKYAH